MRKPPGIDLMLTHPPNGCGSEDEERASYSQQAITYLRTLRTQRRSSLPANVTEPTPLRTLFRVDELISTESRRWGQNKAIAVFGVCWFWSVVCFLAYSASLAMGLFGAMASLSGYKAIDTHTSQHRSFV
jgi:hypothetical protein